MKNQQNAQSRNLFFIVVLLIIWSMASLYIFINYIPRFNLIALALFIFLIVLAITKLFPFAEWISFLLSASVFSGVVYSLLENTREVLITSGIGVGVFLVMTTLIAIYNRQIYKYQQQHDQLQQVIDSLVIYDGKTSLMRWKFAQQALTTEILRGRRYDTKLSVCIFEVWQKSQYPSEDLDRIHQEMANIIEATIREDIDIGFIGDRIGLILPETGPSGADILVGRLIKKFNRKVDARLSAGIASFPKDGVTEDEILDRAEQALKVAMNAGQEIVIYSSLEEGDQEVEQDLEGTEEESELKEGISQESVEEDLPETGEEKDRDGEKKQVAEEQAEVKEEAKGKAKVESTKPINVQEEHPEAEDYTRILKNINLDEDEWVVWIQGFNQMSDLVPLEKELLEIDHVQEINFLFLQENHLVLRLKSTIDDLPRAEKPFPGWEIQKSNQDNRYLLISSEKGTA